MSAASVLTPVPYFDANYSFRYDEKTLQSRRQDIALSMGVPKFRVGENLMFFTYPAGDVVYSPVGQLPANDQLNSSITSAITTYWTVGISELQNLNNGGATVATTLNATYTDDCFTFQVVGNRSYVSRTGLVSGDSIYLRFVFKNLGAFQSPSFNVNFLTGVQAPVTPAP